MSDQQTTPCSPMADCLDREALEFKRLAEVCFAAGKMQDWVWMRRVAIQRAQAAKVLRYGK